MLADDVYIAHVERDLIDSTKEKVDSFVDQLPEFLAIDTDTSLLELTDLPDHVSELFEEAIPMLSEDQWETDSFYVCEVPNRGERLCHVGFESNSESGRWRASGVRRKIEELDLLVTQRTLLPAPAIRVLNRSNSAFSSFKANPKVPDLILLSNGLVYGWLSGSHPQAIRNEQEFQDLKSAVVDLIVSGQRPLSQ